MSRELTAVWQALNNIADPEIPVVSLVEMGIVREAKLDDNGIEVIITPTFSGCPALDVMQKEVEAAMKALGFTAVTVTTVLSPPWSSDWITDEARAKLKAFGLAPPMRHGGNIEVTFFEPICCPRCDSANTAVRNSFGSTLCRAIYYCNECQEPFEQFKPL
jgi:ring-1,2-phenylacetyl-CoA epoxidase subunit PaaD